MNHLSLFSGIGGFDLAAQWMGWNNIAHCEINPFCRQKLSYYWPEAASHSDIKTTDFSIYNGAVDIISGGFPCQPYSTAGLRKGKEDDRHLWTEMLRAIRESSPTWVVGENVRGLISWNGGLVFDEVQADLEAEGYEVLPFLLPACAVDAPHRRDRIWFIAHSGSERRQQKPGSASCYESTDERRPEKLDNIANRDGESWVTPDTESERLEGRIGLQNPPPQRSSIFREKIIGLSSDAPTWRRRKNDRSGKSRFTCQTFQAPDWQDFPTQPPVCGGDDGLPSELDGITFSKWRNESIKGYGNAIVPQVALQIFKAIEQYETETMHQMRH